MNCNTQYTEYGKISASFSQEKLTNLCLDKIGVQTGPFGSQLHNEDYVLVGTPIITVEHLGDNRITYQNMPLVSDEDKARLSKYCIKEGDIVFSRVGSVDRRALVRQEEDGWLFSGRCLRVRVDKTQMDPVYLSYFFGLDGFKNYIKSIAVGATMPSINTKILSNLPIYYPNLETQTKIGQILQKLDDKITLNTQINQTLESMAQAIFKSWFVDFEPVKAKIAAIEAGQDSESVNRAAMRAISGISDDELDKMQAEKPDEYAQLEGTAKLFPAAMCDSELGKVPEGWTWKRADEMCEISIGKTPPRKQSHWFSSFPDGLKWVSIRDMGNCGVFALDTSETLTYDAVNKFNVKKVPDNTLILSFKLTVGRVAITSGEMLTNEAIAHFVQKAGNNIPTSFYYLYLKQFDYNFLGSTSSIATAVNSKTIKAMPIINPSEDIVFQFEKRIDSLFSQIKLLEMQNIELCNLRDTLLPKLLSGELHVADTEVPKKER